MPARNPQCQGQAFLLPVFCGDKQEIRSVKDKPFYCQSFYSCRVFLLLPFCKQNASLQQLLTHMATVMMMMIGEGEVCRMYITAADTTPLRGIAINTQD